MWDAIIQTEAIYVSSYWPLLHLQYVRLLERDLIKKYYIMHMKTQIVVGLRHYKGGIQKNPMQ